MCEKQKNGKAVGPDEIPYEMYKNGGGVLIDRMTELFNRVWEEERVPREWNESRVTLLHKGGYKRKDELKNYRPISLVNTVGKIFSAVLNERLRKWIEGHRVLGEEQNGFRVDRRAEDNMFIVNELIERKRKDGSKVYLGFLDIEKAYDRVNRTMMCKVLEKLGMCEKIVNIIRSMYVDTRAKYRMGEIETDWVLSERGVRQGCVLSPTLFSLYTEELAVRIRGTNAGVKVGDEKLGLLLYADDAVVMSESADELQDILDILSEYGTDFGVRFSAEKSKVMIVNRTEDERGCTWRLGDREIEQTCEYKYLGMWMSPNGCEKAKNEKISQANQWVGRLGSAARMRACKYDVLREVWKSVAVPSVMYGMEVIAWNQNEIDRLEVGQNRVARMALNAPRYAAVEALRGDMGWSTFSERYEKAAMRYRVRLEFMEDTRWAKKIYAWNRRESKWNKKCGRMIGKHGRDGWEMLYRIREEQDVSVNMCKKEIERMVMQYGLLKWKNGLENKSTMAWYKRKQAPRYESWYDGSVGGDLLFRARAQCMDVNARNYRWTESGSKACQKCETGVDETVEHVVLECERYERERVEMMQAVMSEMGCEEGVWMELTGEEWMTLLLGLHDEKNVEMIVAVKKYLERMWCLRNR